LGAKRRLSDFGLPVDQHGRFAGCTEPLGEDDRVPPGRDDPHIERPGGRDLRREPGRRAVDITPMGRVGADAGDGGELDELRQGAVVMGYEILNEPEKAEVLARIESWLDARLPA